MKWGWLPLIALVVGCATPRAVKRTPSPPMPPMPPKTTRATPPRIASIQAPKTFWLVWGPKDWVDLYLEWDRNKETNVVAYVVHRGLAPSDYSAVENVHNNTSARVRVAPGFKYFFAVSAFDADGLESSLSKEVSCQAPTFSTPPFHASITPLTPDTPPVGEYKIESRNSLNAPWEHYAEVTNAFIQVTATDTKFFRVLKKP